MGSLATFKTTYLATSPAVVPTGARQRLAGAVYAVEQRVNEGAAVATARANVTNQRALRDIHRAQRLSNPYQGALAADFLALDSA